MKKYSTQSDYIFEIPPVKNPVMYVWRIAGKIFSFTLFGAGSILLTIITFPVMKLLWRNKKDFQRHARHLVYLLFKFFVAVMSVLSISKIKVDDKKRLHDLRGAVLVSNHPSLLDVVMLISVIPNADCIVNGSLKKNIVARVVANLYITNDVEYKELVERCVESIHDGNVLIIFPEGTRSKYNGQNQYKKGAARIALAAGCPVVPVFQGGNDKIGLKKKDPMLLFNHTDCYRYNLYVKPEISVEEFKELPEPAAAKKVMEKVHQALCYENNWDNITGKNPSL